MTKDWIKGIVGNPGVCWMFKGVTSAPNPGYSYWVSENVYSMFQLMFAIITPALIIGSIAERMKFKAILVFMTLWILIVYNTQGHMVWGVNGMMNGCWNANAKIQGLTSPAERSCICLPAGRVWYCASFSANALVSVRKISPRTASC